MATDLNKVFEALKPDPWRTLHPFSPDIAAANEQLLLAPDDDIASTIINQWIGKNQPCLFGRIAAKADLISYCILTEKELLGDRIALHDKIQKRRREWISAGFKGKKSAFVILVISAEVATATPDENVARLAQELCKLYLLQDEIDLDRFYLDDIFLKIPGKTDTTWKWLAGVNYFCAQGDQRWWHDHRIPGGLALSVNSVGHLVKSGQLSTALKFLGEAMGVPPELEKERKVDSLATALQLAMSTISKAHNTISGKATNLMPFPNPVPAEMPPLPFDLATHAEWDYTTYQGWFNTDFTLPSVFFEDEVERPTDVEQKELDFTYLFHDNIDNPDHIRMGKGFWMSGDGFAAEDDPRMAQMVAKSVSIKDHSILCDAL